MKGPTGLGNGHNILTVADGGKGVALNRSGSLVAGHGDVLEHHRVKTSLVEGGDWGNLVFSALLDFDGVDA